MDEGSDQENPPVPAQPLATPSKSLPPLKDIEHITTPKAFDVAKDDKPVAQASSPPQHRLLQLESLAEDDTFDGANDTFGDAPKSDADAVAAYLGVDVMAVRSIPRGVVPKIAARAAQHAELESEFGYFKLSQELSAQVLQRRLHGVQKELESAHSAGLGLEAQLEALRGELAAREEAVRRLEAEKRSVAADAAALRAAARLREALVLLQEGETSQLQASVDRLTRLGIEQGKRLLEATRELDAATNEKFQLKLELTKTANELEYTRTQRGWFELELRALQQRHTALIKQHDADYLRDATRLALLELQRESAAAQRDALEKEARELRARAEAASAAALESTAQLEVARLRFEREAAGRDDVVHLLQVQVEERNERIGHLELYCSGLRDELAAAAARLEAEVAAKSAAVERLAEKLRRTEEVLDAELHRETELPRLTPLAEMIIHNKPQGISLLALYTEFNHMKKELVLERLQNEKLALELQHFVQELEAKKPAISNYRNQIQLYEHSVKKLLAEKQQLVHEKGDALRELARWRSRAAAHEAEIAGLKQLTRDLGRQLCFYLIHLKIAAAEDEPLSASERSTIDAILAKTGNKDAPDETDTDHVISLRLVGFASIVELQQRNQELLVSVRLLSQQLEARELQLDAVLHEAVEDAKTAIDALERELEATRAKLALVTHERDMHWLAAPHNGSAHNSDKAVAELKQRLAETEQQQRTFRTQSTDKIQKLTAQLGDAAGERDKLQISLLLAQNSVALAESRLESARKMLESTQKEMEHVQSDCAFWRSQASKQEELSLKRTHELRSLEGELQSSRLEAKALAMEKEVWVSTKASLEEAVRLLRADKEQLNGFVVNLQNLVKEREAASKETLGQLTRIVQNYQSLQEKVAEREERIQILSTQSDLAIKAQNAKLEQVSELSQKLLDARAALAEKEAQLESLRASGGAREGQYDAPGDFAVQDLQSAETQVAQFKELAKEAERTLETATELYEEFRRLATEKIEALESEKNRLQLALDDSESLVTQLRREASDAEARAASETEALKAQVYELLAKASSYDQLKAEADGKLDILQRDVSSQNEVTSDLRTRYEAKLDEVSLLTKQVEHYKEQNANTNDQLAEAKAKLELVVAEMEAKELQVSESQRAAVEQLEAANRRVQDLEYQYNIAISQIELNSADSGDLKDVVKFLRREKDLGDSKVVSLQEELEKLRKEALTHTVELEAARSHILRLELAKIRLAELAKEQDKLTDLIQQISILRESNNALREEKRLAEEALAQALQKVVEKTESDPVLEQQVRLLKEENERLKKESNDDKYGALLQRFENLKSEFRQKLAAHRSKNKELEKTVQELKEAGERAGSATEMEAQKAEVELLRAALEHQKGELKTQMAALEAQKSQIESEKSQLELERSQVEARKSEIDAEAAKLNSLKSELESRGTGENADLDARIAEKDAEIAGKVAEIAEKDAKIAEKDAQIAELSTKSNSDDIKALTAEFQATLAEEKSKVEKAIDKKYEFKLKVLNRKVERLEKERSEKEPDTENKGKKRSEKEPDTENKGKKRPFKQGAGTKKAKE